MRGCSRFRLNTLIMDSCLSIIVPSIMPVLACFPQAAGTVCELMEMANIQRAVLTIEINHALGCIQHAFQFNPLGIHDGLLQLQIFLQPLLVALINLTERVSNILK